jgi:hypothetical protein
MESARLDNPGGLWPSEAAQKRKQTGPCEVARHALKLRACYTHAGTKQPVNAYCHAEAEIIKLFPFLKNMLSQRRMLSTSEQM